LKFAYLLSAGMGISPAGPPPSSSEGSAMRPAPRNPPLAWTLGSELWSEELWFMKHFSREEEEEEGW
jgi:hypothetical protein